LSGAGRHCPNLPRVRITPHPARTSLFHSLHSHSAPPRTSDGSSSCSPPLAALRRRVHPLPSHSLPLLFAFCGSRRRRIRSSSRNASWRGRGGAAFVYGACVQEATLGEGDRPHRRARWCPGSCPAGTRRTPAGPCAPGTGRAGTRGTPGWTRRSRSGRRRRPRTRSRRSMPARVRPGRGRTCECHCRLRKCQGRRECIPSIRPR